MKLKVYILTQEKALLLGIAHASGIVGAPEQPKPGYIQIYYEGNIHGAENMKRFEEKLCHAAGRAIQSYPTIAKALVSIDDLTEIGVFDTDTNKFEWFDPQLPLLVQWLL